MTYDEYGSELLRSDMIYETGTIADDPFEVDIDLNAYLANAKKFNNREPFDIPILTDLINNYNQDHDQKITYRHTEDGKYEITSLSTSSGQPLIKHIFDSTSGLYLGNVLYDQFIIPIRRGQLYFESITAKTSVEYIYDLQGRINCVNEERVITRKTVNQELILTEYRTGFVAYNNDEIDYTNNGDFTSKLEIPGFDTTHIDPLSFEGYTDQVKSFIIERYNAIIKSFDLDQN